MRSALPLVYIVISAAFAGCATKPVSYTEAEPVPSSRVLAPELLRARPDAARITVKRDSGFMGSACAFRVFVDGRPVVELRSSERVDIYVDPGQHILGTYATGICGGGTAEVEATVGAGQWKSYRIASGQEGTLQFSPTAF